jgi:hypothetical protein
VADADERPDPIRRLHGATDITPADHDALWAAIGSRAPIACRACGGPIAIDPLAGEPLWRRAWPTIRCAKGCTLLEETFHVNLWPDV